MAFNPEEERRKGRRGALESGMLGGSPLGGMLSAAGMPPIQRARPAWAQAIYNANPPPVDYGSPEYLAMPSSERPNFFGTQNIYSPPSSTGTLDPIPQQKSEAWWAAQPRPPFVPADWVYIGMGDWGPPQPTLAPGDTYGPPTYPGGPGDLAGNLGPLLGLLGPVPGES